MRLSWALTRRKRVSSDECETSQLARVLTCYDLVSLGVGSTLGVGIYVLAGQVAKDIAGPSVVLSFMLAAVVTALAGISFAEFGARVPKAGSAYIYSYYCVGEFPAFVIGWCLILEYGIGAASVARCISSYIDSLTGSPISSTLTEILPLHQQYLSGYVDLLAMSLCLLLAVMLAFGVKESTMINNLLTPTNLCVVLFFIIAGTFNADMDNWFLPKDSIPEGINGGDGGFAPYGITGIIQGAAICFYGFIGFDCIATTGEEVHNPQRAIPGAIIASLGIILSCYLGVATVITLMVPYYLQNSDAPIPYAFEVVGWHTAKWIISVGALFGLFSSLFGGLFPLPRIIYAMAQDGLLFRWLGNVHPRLQTPLIATLVSGACTAALAGFFNLQQLVGLNAIGTLLTYALVSICILVLRYEESPEDLDNTLGIGEETRLLSCSKPNVRQLLAHFLSFRSPSIPTVITSRLVVVNTLLFCVLSVALSTLLVLYNDYPLNWKELPTLMMAFCSLAMILLMISIARQPMSCQELSFKMPLVPYTPCISIFVDIYLMAVLDGHTWIRFAVCMLVGKFRKFQNIRQIVLVLFMNSVNNFP